MENNTFKVINEEGREIVCDILFTDNSKDEAGNIQVFASIYDPKQESPKLEPIETEQEWKIIETILNTLHEEIKKKATTHTEEGNNEQ